MKENIEIYTGQQQQHSTKREQERSCANAKREKARKQNVKKKISQNEKFFFVFFLHFNTQQRKTHVAIELCSSKKKKD